MSEETKNTAELTDKQLEKVAGGEGGEPESSAPKRAFVRQRGGANIYPEMSIFSPNLTFYPFGEVLYNCYERNPDWVYVLGQYGLPDGYVLKSDLRLF